MTKTADKLSPFLATSAVLHVGVFALVLLGPVLFPKRAETSWGSSSDKNITVGVAGSLPGIPLPSPPVVQEKVKPNDSKTLHPAEVAPKATTKVPTKPADVKIPERGATKTSKAEPAPSQVAKADVPPASATETNAIRGAGGQIALPYGAAAGTGQATFGGDGTFGTRFPEYVTALIRAIESQWQDPAARTGSKRAYVSFTIVRSGKNAVATDVQLAESSGLGQLDRSAVRAVSSASLPSLPPGYSGSSVDVRFYFESKH